MQRVQRKEAKNRIVPILNTVFIPVPVGCLVFGSSLDPGKTPATTYGVFHTPHMSLSLLSLALE